MSKKYCSELVGVLGDPRDENSTRYNGKSIEKKI